MTDTITIHRGQKVFNPTTGLRKYVKLDVECNTCGARRIINPHELENALKSTSDYLIRFRCRSCQGGVRAINRQWFEWSTYQLDLFTPW